MLKKLIVFSGLCFLFFKGFSQETKDDLTRLQNGEDLNVLYRNEGSIGIYAHTAGGFGLAYRRGKHVTAKRKRMFEVEAQNFKHPKEVKIVNPNYQSTKGFYYGKLNSFFVIRPGAGYQNVLYQKISKKSVEIRYSYFIGATITFAKPVYLEIITPTGSQNLYTRSSERYNPAVHYPDNILGRSSFYRGLDKTTIYPGGYVKFALSFEYADRYNGIKAIETGAILDVYPRVLPMMAFNKNQQVFASLYLKMIWGKKWF